MAYCIPVVGEQPDGFNQLYSDADAFVNYSGVETDPQALAILMDYVKSGRVREFNALAELSEHVQGTPVLSKFACIVKSKLDGSVKHRIIMDSKQSGVTAASAKQYRSVLPRQTDLVHDILS